jgi:hypothetical protein
VTGAEFGIASDCHFWVPDFVFRIGEWRSRAHAHEPVSSGSRRFVVLQIGASSVCDIVPALQWVTAPVAYVGALQACLDSERKRCDCGGVGTPTGAPGVVLFSKKAHLPGAPGDPQAYLEIPRRTHVIEGAPVLSIRRTWVKKKRA